MESGTLPPPTMLLHSNDSIQQMSSSHSPMNQYSDIFPTRQSVQTNNKTNKRKLDEVVDPSITDFDSSSSLKPQKTERTDPERSLSRTGTRKKNKIHFEKQITRNYFVCLALSNGSLPPPPPSLTPSRNGNDRCPSSFDFGSSNNNNAGSTTPNPSLLTHQTPPPPSLQQQQSLPPPLPASSYMPMSPRNQYTITSDSPFLQTNNQVYVFTTQLANEAADSVLKNEHPNIIEYHRGLPSTNQYLSVSEIYYYFELKNYKKTSMDYHRSK
jgi:hypothetical protein